MADERNKGRRWAIAVATVLILYPLSIGPVWSLINHGYLSPEAFSRIVLLYQPLLWLSEKFQFFGDALDVYLNLWLLL